MTEQAVKIEAANLEYVEHAGVRLVRGYVYSVQPGPDAIRDFGKEYELSDGSTHFEPQPVGFHGCDLPPCSGDWVADYEDGYLVISKHEYAADIDRVDGWMVEPHNEEIDYADGAGTTKTVKFHRHSGEQVLAMVY